MKKIILLLIVILLISGSFYFYSKKTLKNEYVLHDNVDISIKSDIYGDWVWKSSIDVAKKEVFPDDPSKFILTLTPEGKLTSTTDCNLVSGSFVKNDEYLSFGTLSATEMACNGNTLEVFYMSSLAMVSSYNISENSLVLNLAKDSGIMFFEKNEI